MHRKYLGLALVLALASVGATPAPQSPAAALEGRVSSDGEGAMEGVLVCAKGDGKTISVTVVSDRAGRYSFPASRLAPGKYWLDIRAVGYDLASPASVEVAAGRVARADLKLVKTKDLVAQLTSSEWLQSVPGTEAQKNQLFRCAACHSLTRIAQSRYDEQGFETIFARMRGYSEQAVPAHPVSLPYPVSVQPDPAFARYLTTINLSATSAWKYELKTNPRPTGRAARVIITEYDLPDPGRLPHDADLDAQGMVWYNDFREPLIGRLVGGNIGKIDAKTGKVALYKTPTLNSGPRRISVDPEDRVWFGEYYANKLGMFDPKSGQFKEWTAPTPWVGPYPAKTDKNGEAWTAGMSTDLILRLDPKSGQFTEYMLPTVDANIRHIDVDNSTNPVTAWVAEVHQGKIARIEPLD
jgi:virginiamycin B lyase